MDVLSWDYKTKFLDEQYFDLHWIIIRRIKRKLDFRWKCLYGTHRQQKNIPDWFEDYFVFFNGQHETNTKAEIWNKTDEKWFQAHCLICKLHVFKKKQK
jgi:hypothetical protein